MDDPSFEHTRPSDDDDTHGSAYIRSFDNTRMQSPGYPAESTQNSDTMSKVNYYTLRDKGIPLQHATLASNSEPASIERPSGPVKLKPCSVVMLDGSVHSFDVDPQAKAQDLFDATCAFLSLHEKEYFSLCYRDSNNMFFWLQHEKKLGKQIGKNEWRVEVMVKFYPPDPENLRESLSRYYIALQIRQNLMAELLPCSFISYIILGSYVVQSEIGDFVPSEHQDDADLTYLQDCPFCPEEYRQAELLHRVSELHKCHTGMTPEEADLHFLVNAKKLAMYGVELHTAKDSNNDEVRVGVYHSGVLIYRNSLRINRFSWAKILKVSYVRSTLKIAIRSGDEKEPQTREAQLKPKAVIEFKCPSQKLAKRLWLAVVEHHGFFRLKLPEKPVKPLIPGTFKRNWNYTGPTRGQLTDQPYGTLPQETQITAEMRKSFRKKDDAFNRDQRLLQQSNSRDYATYDSYSSVGRERQMQQQQQQPAEQWDRRPQLAAERPARWHLNPSDADSYMLLNANNGWHCSAFEAEWQGVRADHGVYNGGQWYYEVTVNSDNGSSPVDCRIGWLTSTGSLNVGQDGHGFAFGASPLGQHGQKCNSGKEEPYGRPLNCGDVVGVFLDIDNGLVMYSINGQEQGVAYTLPQELRREIMFPAVCVRGTARANCNFGDNPAEPLQHRPGQPWRPVGLAPSNQSAENPLNWRLNQHDNSGPGLVLAPDNCSAQGQMGFGWQGIRANKGIRGKNGGKYYYEIEPLEERGLARVGWTTENGALEVGRDANGWGYGADHEGFGLAGNQGKKLHSDEIDNYGEPFAKGDVIGCFFDMDHGQMQYCRNGNLLGLAYTLPISRLDQEAFFPTVCMRDQTLDVNFGQRSFKYPPGSGWTPVCAANDDSVRRSARTGVMDRKSKGFTYVDPRMLQESLSKRNSNLPAVDQKYDHIRETKPQIQAQQQHRVNGASHAVNESRTESEEVGEPEEEIVTYTDEQGNKITKKVIRRKQVRQVITNKVVESRAVPGPACFDPHNSAGTEHVERNLNGKPQVHKETRTTRRNIISSSGGEGDDMLDEMIYTVTGFSKEDRLVDENVNDFSMSTLDNRRKGKHESEI